RALRHPMTTPAALVTPVPRLAAARGPLVVTALAALLALLVVASLTWGQVHIPLDQLLDAVTARESPAARIIIELRLPRILAAIFGGAAIATAGLLLQALFRNPLADSWSLGLTAGGQFGAALVVAGGGIAFASSEVAWLRVFGGLSLVAGAVLGTVAVAIGMGVMARRVGSITLLVLGLMLGFLAQGLMSVVLHFTNQGRARIFASWNDATFAGVQRADLLPYLAPIVVGIVVTALVLKPLSALLLGESYARSLGVDIVRLRRVALGAAILLAAPVTAYCGPLVFLGLIVPHLARGLRGTAQLAPLLPVVLLGGALVALAGDFVVHLPWEQHFLHLNAILAVIGAPVVIVLLLVARSMRLGA
ncbi:MAG: iron ABC transporter permease, partial [Gemmatimonadaceae bacterium]|nr:iron ABC transporter permease [Gemmatimonadaceae bacterium]MCU0627458.1 iron ABC transporter permease [Gemmatimonadaceae bacterium]